MESVAIAVDDAASPCAGVFAERGEKYQIIPPRIRMAMTTTIHCARFVGVSISAQFTRSPHKCKTHKSPGFAECLRARLASPPLAGTPAPAGFAFAHKSKRSCASKLYANANPLLSEGVCCSRCRHELHLFRQHRLQKKSCCEKRLLSAVLLDTDRRETSNAVAVAVVADACARNRARRVRRPDELARHIKVCRRVNRR